MIDQRAIGGTESLAVGCFQPFGFKAECQELPFHIPSAVGRTGKIDENDTHEGGVRD